MAKLLDSSQKASAERKGIEDALKGTFKPERAETPHIWHIDAKKREEQDVYKEAFYRTRGSEPPKT